MGLYFHRHGSDWSEVNRIYRNTNDHTGHKHEGEWTISASRSYDFYDYDRAGFDSMSDLLYVKGSGIEISGMNASPWFALFVWDLVQCVVHIEDGWGLEN